VDEIFNSMIKYSSENELLMHVQTPEYVQHVNGQLNWERAVATVSWDKPTPSFQKCAAKRNVDLNDDIMCYAIAAIEIFNLDIATFMQCVITNILSEGEFISTVIHVNIKCARVVGDHGCRYSGNSRR